MSRRARDTPTIYFDASMASDAATASRPGIGRMRNPRRMASRQPTETRVILLGEEGPDDTGISDRAPRGRGRRASRDRRTAFLIGLFLFGAVHNADLHTIVGYTLFE